MSLKQMRDVDLADILRAGGNLDLDAHDRADNVLLELATMARANKRQFTIRNFGTRSSLMLEGIVRKGGGYVTLVG